MILETASCVSAPLLRASTRTLGSDVIDAVAFSLFSHGRLISADLIIVRCQDRAVSQPRCPANGLAGGRGSAEYSSPAPEVRLPTLICKSKVVDYRPGQKNSFFGASGDHPANRKISWIDS